MSMSLAAWHKPEESSRHVEWPSNNFCPPKVSKFWELTTKSPAEPEQSDLRGM